MENSVRNGIINIILSIPPFILFLYIMLHTEAYKTIPSLLFFCATLGVALVLLVWGIAKIYRRV